MTYKHNRSCRICGKRDLKTIHTHPRNVHKLNAIRRSPWLKLAKRSTWLGEYGSVRLDIPTSNDNSDIKLIRRRRHINSNQKKLDSKTITEVVPKMYSDFRFRHKFSLMVIGPSVSGKSYFVKQMLERDHIDYERDRKPRQIHWFYGPYQDMFMDMKRSIEKDIYFKEGLPEFQADLSDIESRYNNVIVLDDLMDLAVDNPIITKLFTQGRHRNASVILLLQNAFPKGKYNTSISRNVQYMALFRCPVDRRQIGIMADRIFDKNKPSFMKIYNDITSKPYSYVLVDNKADTPAHRQIIIDVFENCVSYTVPGTAGRETVNDVSSDKDRIPQNTTNSVMRVEDKEYSVSTLLKRDDRQSPILVRLSSQDWLTVNELFREAERGGNLPPGWIMWRLYAVNVPDYYKPVIIKKSDSTVTKFYHVSKDWLLAYYPQFRDFVK